MNPLLIPLFFLASGDSRIESLLKEISPAQIQKTVEDLVAFKNRNTNGETEAGEKGVGAARRYLKQKLEGFAPGRLKVSEEWFLAEGARIKTPLNVANVVAALPGSKDASRIYVVGGHYDSINGDKMDIEGFAPGANDDASGTAVAIELARVLSKQEFPATILFVCYVGEEQGLLGSKHHASKLKESGAFVDGMIGNDIVGSSLGGNGVRDDRTIRIFSASAAGNDSPSRQFARLAREIGALYLPDADPTLVFRSDRFGRGGDHLSFEEQGFPALRFTEPNEDYRHQHQNVKMEKEIQYGDLPNFVDFNYTAKVARLNLAVIANLALAPRTPKNVQVKGAVSYETTLSWEAVASDDLEGYEIVWRKTTDPYWTDSKLVGKSTQFVLPVLLDNHVVGVRSVGSGGTRSRVSVPKGM